jgi:hypothetical protein
MAAQRACMHMHGANCPVIACSTECGGSNWFTACMHAQRACIHMHAPTRAVDTQR